MTTKANGGSESPPQENPTSNSDTGTKQTSESLGRFKSIEAKRRSLGNLTKPFQVGHPPLPGAGRPKNDGPATKELRRLLTKKFPNDSQRRTYLKLVVESLVKSAIKGDIYAQHLLWDRLEGRMPLPIEGDNPAAITGMTSTTTSIDN